MFTVDGQCFTCSKEIAERVAGWAGLDMVIGKSKYAKYTLWEDYQTGGGGCRIVWKSGYVFVSRHSGYAYADVTQEVIFFLQEQGAKPTKVAIGKNPHIYGMKGWAEHEQAEEAKRYGLY